MQQRHRDLETIYKKLSVDADRLVEENKQLKVECKHANNALINLEAEKLHASAECSQLLEGRYNSRKIVHTFIHKYSKKRNTCNHIHAYTHMHTYIRYIHTYIHTYIHNYLHTFIHIFIH